MDYVSSPSGLILPRTLAEFEARRMKRPKAMEFFAGAGGMALGIIEAGYEVVAVAEWNAEAVVTLITNLCRYGEHKVHFVEDADYDRFEKALLNIYRNQGLKTKDGKIVDDGTLTTKAPLQAGQGWISNQPRSTPSVSHVFFGDVRKLTSQRILDAIGMKKGELDLVSGGPPCQGYSRAGKQNVMDPRNSLVFEWARFVVELNPKALLMEEVPEVATMLTPEGVPVIDQLSRILQDGGFGGVDAFKKSLAAQLGVGLMRGSQKSAARPKPNAKSDVAPVMDDLFSEGV